MSENAEELAATIAASHEALVQEAYERGKRHGEKFAPLVINGPLRINPAVVHSLVVHCVGDGRESAGTYFVRFEGGRCVLDFQPS
jgi:hypothetical protein